MLQERRRYDPRRLRAGMPCTAPLLHSQTTAHQVQVAKDLNAITQCRASLPPGRCYHSTNMHTGHVQSYLERVSRAVRLPFQTLLQAHSVARTFGKGMRHSIAVAHDQRICLWVHRPVLAVWSQLWLPAAQQQRFHLACRRSDCRRASARTGKGISAGHQPHIPPLEICSQLVATAHVTACVQG